MRKKIKFKAVHKEPKPYKRSRIKFGIKKAGYFPTNITCVFPSPYFILERQKYSNLQMHSNCITGDEIVIKDRRLTLGLNFFFWFLFVQIDCSTEKKNNL